MNIATEAEDTNAYTYKRIEECGQCRWKKAEDQKRWVSEWMNGRERKREKENIL